MFISASSGNFLLSVIMAGSLQQLWGTIRAMQTIILAGLVEIPMPAHTMVFMQGCMQVAQLDVLDGEGFFIEYFDMKDTP